MNFRELGGDQRKQLIDTLQVYEAWRTADTERRRRFQGGMRWVERNGTEYLLRKIGKRETSLGARSADTERAFQAFQQGRERNTDRLRNLAKRLDELAPVNRAMGLGRVPKIAARILRSCDEYGLLGRQLLVVGTNALFAYESAAGVQFYGELLATGDVDFLLDARRQLTLAAHDISHQGLLGLLQRIDTSFQTRGRGDYKATNRDGYIVDLICPEVKDMRVRAKRKLSDVPDDLDGAQIHGLAWLVNAPRFLANAVDDGGYPVPLATLDPRTFAVHKAWLASETGREALKRNRDMEQAQAVAQISMKYLNMKFDEAGALDVLPNSVRTHAAKLTHVQSEPAPDKGPLRPSW